MSPLLTARPSVSVTLRLLGACVVTAVVAAFVPLAGGDGRIQRRRPRVPDRSAIVCAALIEPPALRLRARPSDDGRLAWMSVGMTIALLGLITTLLALPSAVPGRRAGQPEPGRRRGALPDLARRRSSRPA